MHRQSAELTLQLEEERALAEQLSAELEAPENSKRWRKLEGKDPEPEDLAAKLQVLEELAPNYSLRNAIEAWVRSQAVASYQLQLTATSCKLQATACETRSRRGSGARWTRRATQLSTCNKMQLVTKCTFVTCSS